MKRLLGVIEDFLVWLDKFILSADFVILDCEVDYDVHIILGRHFLATCKTLCEIEVGELTFRLVMKKWYSICVSSWGNQIAMRYVLLWTW